jgi:AraC-like DNA-binding protein
MLFARGELAYEPARIRLFLGIGRRLQFQVIERAYCTWDTRYLPPREAVRDDRLIFHIYLEGRVEVGGREIATPFVLLTTETQYTGTKDRPAEPLRAGGPDFLKIELTLPVSDVRLPVPGAPLQLATSDGFIATARAFAEEIRRGEPGPPTLEKGVESWLMSLAREGWVGAETFRALADRETSALARLWRAFAPSFAVFDLKLSLALLSSRAGVTARQLARNIDELLLRMHYPLRFRAIVAEQRVRAAVMFLAAPHARVDEVARLVGYASTESMAAAFRDAGLPSPREVQRGVSEPFA